MLSSESIRPDESSGPVQEKVKFRLGRALEASKVGNIGIVRGDGGSLALQFVSMGVIRLKLFPGEGMSHTPDMGSTEAVVRRDKPLSLELQSSELEFRWTCGAYTVALHKEDCCLRFLDGNDRVFATVSLMEWTGTGEASVRLGVQEDCHYYGLGETTGFLDKRGERYEMWNSDIFSPHVPDMEALYQSIPFLTIHSPAGAYGVFLDNPGRSSFDMRTDPESVILTADTGCLDLYVLAGPRPKDVLMRYAALTGTMSLPPRWALGYHQSRFSYESQEEALEVARTLREKGIPCDALHLDIHYMDGYRVFTFDPERFPDPKGMIADLKKMGIRTIVIVDPGVKLDPEYSIYREGLDQGFFCIRPDGEPFVGPVWPGDSLFPDFLNEDAADWWGDHHKYYAELGVEGVWNDMNEPSVFNEHKTLEPETRHRYRGESITHREAHNLYGLLMCKSTWEGMEKHLGGGRPFVLTRAGYAGIQRYAAVWTGDNRSYWEHLAMSIPMVLNLGLSGVAFAGSDIGGFAHHTSGELLARWMQVGALYPYCRNHSERNSIRQEPWSFGPRVEEICRSYIRFRCRIMPYLYSLFREAAETGIPVMRPLVLEHPDDPRTYNLCDQFLVGSHLLAAPVCRPATDYRSVYLPVGGWFDYWTGARYEGPCTILAHAPLETLPLYVKEGMILPSTGEDPQELIIDVYGSGTSSGVFELYDDDGETTHYRDGSYNLYRLEFTEADGRVRFLSECLHRGYSSSWSRCMIRFHGLHGDRNVHVQGAEQAQWTVSQHNGFQQIRLENWTEHLEIILELE